MKNNCPLLQITVITVNFSRVYIPLLLYITNWLLISYRIFRKGCSTFFLIVITVIVIVVAFWFTSLQGLFPSALSALSHWPGAPVAQAVLRYVPRRARSRSTICRHVRATASSCRRGRAPCCAPLHHHRSVLVCGSGVHNSYTPLHQALFGTSSVSQRQRTTHVCEVKQGLLVVGDHHSQCSEHFIVEDLYHYFFEKTS